MLKLRKDRKGKIFVQPDTFIMHKFFNSICVTVNCVKQYVIATCIINEWGCKESLTKGK